MDFQLNLLELSFSEILNELQNPNNADSVKSCDLDLIHYYANEFLHDDEKPLDLISDSVEFCEQAFGILSGIGNPKELLIAFMEVIEDVRRVIRFKIMLPPIQTVLLRIEPVEKRVENLDWFLQHLHVLLEQIAVPPNYGLEGEEQNLMQVDEAVNQIFSDVEELVEFYKPFVAEACLWRSGNTDTYLTSMRQILIKSVIHVFDRPLTYVDLSKTTGGVLAEMAGKLVGYFCQLENDVMKLNEYRDLPTASLATMFFVIHASGVQRDKLYCVYSNRYVFKVGLRLSRSLLDIPHESAVHKGLAILQFVLSLIAEMEFEEQLLGIEHFIAVSRSLINIMITNSVVTLRKQSVQILILLGNRFELAGRYKFYIMLMNSVTHAGVQDLLILEFKKSLILVLGGKHTDGREYFMGWHLERVIKLMIRLPKGAETDLIEERERILAALNFLLFLFKRDLMEVNVTGAWNLVETVQEKFLIPLQSAIDLSKAHFTAELGYQRELEAGKGPQEDETEVSVSIQGLPLPALPVKQKIDTLQSMLTSLDLMQSVLSYVNETVRVK